MDRKEIKKQIKKLKNIVKEAKRYNTYDNLTLKVLEKVSNEIVKSFYCREQVGGIHIDEFVDGSFTERRITVILESTLPAYKFKSYQARKTYFLEWVIR